MTLPIVSENLRKVAPWTRDAAVCGLLLALAAACFAEQEIPQGAVIVCADDDECPRGYRCVLERCLEKGVNSAPSVTILPIARSLETVSINVIVFDADADVVALNVEHAVGSGPFQRIALEGRQIVAAAEGTRAELLWEARETLEAAGHLGFVEELVVRITPTDASAMGPADVSEPFAFGNVAPTVSAVSVDGNLIQGVTLVRFRVSDTPADPVDITRFQVSGAGDFSDTVTVGLDTGAGTGFPGGNIHNLETSEAGVPHVVAWDSRGTAGYDATAAAVRLQVTDSFGAISNLAATIEPLMVDNQPQPRIEDVVAGRAERIGGASPIAIHYRLFHILSGPADIRVEYSLDLGTNWFACNEYRAPWSEGLYDLATGPDGVAHTFVWDTTGLSLGTRPVQARITSTDGNNLAMHTVAVPLPHGATPTGLPPNDSPFAEADHFQVGPLGDHPTFILAADFNGDSAMDLATTNAESDNAAVFLSNSDGTFAFPSFFATGDSPWAMAAADFDADSILDVAVINRGSDDLSVLLGNGTGVGDGTFTAAGTYQVGASPWHITTGFFDSDGIVDLAVASTVGSVSILLGIGDGSFAAASDFAAGGGATFVASADFNDDGAVDLLTTDTLADSVSVLLGAGNGSFAAPVSYGAGDGPWGAAVGDFDADGIEDLAVANSFSATLSVLIGNGDAGAGDGTFTPVADYPVGLFPRSIITADFNSDGVLDLASANWEANSISVLAGLGASGSGDGTFDAAVGHFTPRPSWILATDLDGDAVLDLAVSNMSEDTVSVFSGNGTTGSGDGTFAGADTLGLHNHPWQAGSADLDGDGVTDLAVVNRGADNLAIFIGEGDGTFSAPTLHHTGLAPTALAIADFDADTILDLAVTLGGSNEVTILRGNGSGAFTVDNSYPVGIFPFWVETADLDNDGVLDLAVANADSNTVSVLLGQETGGIANGRFAPAVDYQVGTNPGLIAVADFNGDSTLDLAVRNTNESNLSLLVGNGGGSFTGAAARIDMPHLPWGLVAADLNTDGHTDLVASHPEIDAVSVHISNGDGSFVETGQFFAGDGAFGLQASDVNNDGIMDVAVAAYFTDRVAIMLGRGTAGVGGGLLGPPEFFLVGSAPVAVTLDDFNDDGFSDVAALNFESDNISVLASLDTRAGIGDGTLAPAIPVDVGGSPAMLTSADFDQDGVLDLAVANSGSGNVSVLLGSGAGGVGHGTFETPVDYAVGSLPLAIVAGDFDNDGVIDLATADSGVDQVSILLSTGADGVSAGGFGSAQNISTGTEPCGLAAIDLNHDAAIDLIVANRQSNDVSILLGIGDGSFSGSTEPVGAGPSFVTTCDFDADGSADLAVTNTNADSVTVLLNDGAGGLTSLGADLAVGAEPSAVLCHDLNSDGILDLTIANTGDNDVSILQGDGSGGVWNGGFGARLDISTGAAPRALAAADVNGDGTIDLVTATTAGVGILPGQSSRGLATGGFANPVSFAAGDSPASVVAIDSNRDGIADLLVANEGSDNLSVMLGQLQDYRASWLQRLVGWDPTGTSSSYFGADVLPSGLDRFGDPYVSSYVSGHRARLPAQPGPPGFVPLTDTWQIHGDLRLARVTLPSGEPRLRVESRFGPRRQPTSNADFSREGLDLSPSDPDDQRGIVVVLPILEGRSTPLAADVHVTHAVLDWTRASDFPADPLATDPEAAQYLPRAPDGMGGTSRDVVIYRISTTEVSADADDNLGTGQDARFVIRHNPPRVEVLTDQLGLFCAFVRAQ
ncbi:FG-GAP-like repeat-containing protein [Myxococcota bacterium]